MPIDSSGNYWIARDSSGTYSADYYMALARNNASTIVSYNNTINSFVTSVSQPINSAIDYYPKTISDSIPIDPPPIEHTQATTDAVTFLFRDGMNDFVDSLKPFSDVFGVGSGNNASVINATTALSIFQADFSGNLVLSPYYLYQGGGPAPMGGVRNSVFLADAIDVRLALTQPIMTFIIPNEYDAEIENFMNRAKAMKEAFDALKNSLEAEPTTVSNGWVDGDTINSPEYYDGFNDYALKNFYIFLHNLLNNTLSFDSSNNLLYNTISFDSSENPIYTLVIDSSNNPLPILDSSNNRIPIPGSPGNFKSYTNIYNRLRFDSSNNLIIPAFPSALIEDLVNSVTTATTIMDQAPQAPPPPTFVSQITDSSGITRIKFRGDTTQVPQAPFIQARFEYDSSGGILPNYTDASGNSTYAFVDIFNSSFVADTTKIFNSNTNFGGINVGVNVDASGICFAEFIFANPILTSQPYTISWYLTNEKDLVGSDGTPSAPASFTLTPSITGSAPGTPNAPTFVSKTTTAIVVRTSITGVSGSPPNSYRFRATDSSNNTFDSTGNEPLDASGNYTDVIELLSAGRLYNITVSLFNLFGNSTSSAIQVTTGIGPGIANAPTLVSKTLTSLTVRSSTTGVSGGPFTGCRFTATGGLYEDISTPPDASGNYTVTFNNLQSATEYSMSITLFNEYDTNNSFSSDFSTGSVPGTPNTATLVSATPTSLTLASNTTGVSGSPFTAVNFIARDSSGNQVATANTTNSIDASGNRLADSSGNYTGTITGLSALNSYSVTVRFSNTYGQSAVSAPFVVSTSPPPPPGTPPAPTLVSRSGNDLTVRSNSNVVSGGPFTRVNFIATDSSGIEASLITVDGGEIDASGNYTGTLTDLFPNTSYSVTVKYTSEYGEGGVSAPLSASTLPPPGTPPAPIFVALVNNTLTVTSNSNVVSGGPFDEVYFAAKNSVDNMITSVTTSDVDSSGNYTVTISDVSFEQFYGDGVYVYVTYKKSNVLGGESAPLVVSRPGSDIGNLPLPIFISKTSTSITVRISTTGISGGPFTSYDIAAADLDDNEIMFPRVNGAPDASGNYIFTATGLLPDTQYDLRLRLYNIYGLNSSLPLTVSTNASSLPGNPDHPIIISATPNSVTLRLNTNGVSGGPFTGYIFRAIDTVNIDSSGNRNVDASGNYSSSANVAPDGSGNYTATITGLSSTRLYEAYVILKNSDGNSDNGSFITVSALGTPGTPPAPILNASDFNSLLVSVNLQGILGGYFNSGRFTITDSSGYSYFQNAVGNQFAYITNFIGLPPSKTYQISITISNSFGTRTSASLTASTTSIPTYSANIDTIVSQTIATLNGYSTTLDQIYSKTYDYYQVSNNIRAYDFIASPSNVALDGTTTHSQAVIGAFNSLSLSVGNTLQYITEIESAIIAFKQKITTFISNLSNLGSQNLNVAVGTYDEDVENLYDMNITFNGYFQGLQSNINNWSSLTTLQQAVANDTAWNTANQGPDSLLDTFINGVSVALTNSPFPSTNPIDTSTITTSFENGGVAHSYIIAEPRKPSIPSLVSITTDGTNILLKVRGNRNSILEGYFSVVYFNLTTLGGSSYATVNTLQNSSLTGDSSGTFIETFTFIPDLSVYNIGEGVSITWGAINVNNVRDSSNNNLISNASDPLIVMLRPPQPSIPNAPLLVSATTSSLTLRNNATGITGKPLSDVNFTAVDSGGNLRRVNASNNQDASGNYVADSSGNYTGTITGLSASSSYNLRTTLNNGNSPSTSEPFTASTTSPPPGTPNAPTQVSVTSSSITVRSSTIGISGSPFNAFRFRATDSSNNTFDSSGNTAPDASGNYNATIGGLTSGRLYSVTTTLFNTAGNTTSSATQITTTSLPGTPPAPTYVSKTTSSITVRSNSISGGPFTQVRFTATDSSGATLTADAGNVDASGNRLADSSGNYTATINGLTLNGINYSSGFNVTVRYSNANGQGGVSAPLTVIYPGVPQAPIFISKTSTTITTRISTTGLKGAPFTGYIFGVEDKFDTQIQKTFFTVNGPPDASGNYIFTATGLLPNREYGLEVGIFNIFTVIGSDPIVIRTNNSPTTKLISLTPNSVTLRVNTNGGAFTGCIFRAIDTVNIDSSGNRNVDASGNYSSSGNLAPDGSGNYTATITGLSSTRLYKAYVILNISNGYIEESRQITVSGLGIPGTPPVPILIASDFNSLLVGINLENTLGGYFDTTRFIITDSSGYSYFQNAIANYDNASIYSTNFIGLPPSTSYQIAFTVSNSFGGRTSASLTAPTPSIPVYNPNIDTLATQAISALVTYSLILGEIRSTVSSYYNIADSLSSGFDIDSSSFTDASGNTISHSAQVISAFQDLKANISSAIFQLDTMAENIQTVYNPAVTEFTNDLSSLRSVNLLDPDANNYSYDYFTHLTDLIDTNSTFAPEYNSVANKISTWSLTALQTALANTDSAWNTANGGPDTELAAWISSISSILTNSPFPSTNPINTSTISTILSSFNNGGTALSYIIAEPRKPSIPSLVSITRHGTDILLKVRGNRNSILEGYFNAIYFNLESQAGSYANVNTLNINRDEISNGNFIATFTFTPDLSIYNVGELVSITWGAVNAYNDTDASGNIPYNASDPLLVVLRPPQPSTPNAPTLVSATSSSVTLRNNVNGITGKPFSDVKFTAFDTSGNVRRANTSNSQDASGNYITDASGNYTGTITGLSERVYSIRTILNNGYSPSTSEPLTKGPIPGTPRTPTLVSKVEAGLTVSTNPTGIIGAPYNEVRFTATDSSGNTSSTSGLTIDASGNYIETIGGLDGLIVYSITVTFINDYGSTTSSSISIKTLQVTPSTPPLPTLVANGSTYVSLTEDLFNLAGAPFTDCEFNFTDSSENVITYGSLLDASGNNPPDSSGVYSITTTRDLSRSIGKRITPSTYYDVTATIYNEAGNNVTSSIPLTTLAEAKTASLVSRTSTSVTLRNPLAYDTNNILITKPISLVKINYIDSSGNYFRDASGNMKVATTSQDSSGNYVGTIANLSSGNNYVTYFSFTDGEGNLYTSVPLNVTTVAGSAPGTPQAPTLVSASSTSLTVRSNVNGVSGGPFNSVSFTATDSSGNTTQQNASNSQDASGNYIADSSGNYLSTIGSLVSNKTYSITVKLINIYGNATSVGTSITTGGVPGTPNAPTEVSVTGSSITVRSSTTGVSGGPFTAYRFRATDSSNNTFDSSGNGAPDSSGNYSATIGGLASGRVYSLTTTLSNIYGNATSVGTSITTGGVPGTPNAPTEVSVTGSSITVRSSTTGVSGGPFTAYRFRATDSSNNTFDSSGNGAPDSSGNYSATIGGLATSRVYSVTTNLSNIYGNATSIGTSITTGGVPGTPNAPILISRTISSITVRNSTTGISGGPFNAYRFRATDSSGIFSDSTANGPPDASGNYTATINVLFSGKVYNVITTLYNIYGNTTGPGTAITTGSIPSIPNAPTLVRNGSTSVSIRNNTNSIGSPFTQCNFVFRDTNSNAVTYTIDGAPDNSGFYNLTTPGIELAPLTTYNIYTTLYNEFGNATSLAFLIVTTLIQSSQPTIVSVGTNSIVVISNLSRDTAGLPVIKPITNVAINYEQATSMMMFTSFASNTISGTGTVSGPDGSGNYTGTITGLSSSSNYNVYFSFLNVAGNYTSAPVVVTTKTNGICFKTGSKILCLKDSREQYVRVEELRRGDLVRILSGEYIKINLIGKSMIDNPDNGDRGPNRLFILRRANYPDLNEDLIITGCHSRLVDRLTDRQRNRHLQLMSNLYMTTGKFRLMAFIDENAEPYRDPGVHEIWHFALDNANEVCNYGVYANGLLVETASIKNMSKIAGINLL